MQKVRVGIIGISGYTGLELLKILIHHPHFDLTYIANTQGIEDIASLHPCLHKVCHAPVHTASVSFAKECCDLLFLALPHKEAMSFTKEAIKEGLKIVDLSADYRLNAQTYEQYYTTHMDKENLEKAVYGLIEWQRGLIKKAQLVANPGCYPTASLLGILPFTPYINPEISIFIDAKSGVSGAGKTLSSNTHYSHINENMFAYAPLSHRHQPEIEEKINLFGKCDLKVKFIPHLTPITRGMLTSTFIQLTSDRIDAAAILQDCYRGEKFIRIKNEPVQVKQVSGTHFCDIYIKQEGKELWINTAIDNLLRGASSQAVANANLMCGFDESIALPLIAYVP